MYREIQYKDLEDGRLRGPFQFIDARSPKEYNSETIPGSINLPIFSDEERVVIGTEYKNGSIDKAKRIGIEAASKKLPYIFDKIIELNNNYNNLIFFCARGGFRSKSVTSIFESLGFNVVKLEGGYKGYRHFINENLPNIVKDIRFIMLYGNSGSGKTEILKHIKSLGGDILDLEGCANHRGSLLGGVGLGLPNTQKMFESLVYNQLKSRKSNIVFTEGESKRIGPVVIPKYLYNSITSGDNIKIEANIDTRINIIYKEYVDGKKEDNQLIKSLNSLRKYLGDNNIDSYIEMVKQYNYKPVIKELLLKYYDPLYEFKDRQYIDTFYNVDNMKTAKEVINKCLYDI